jgi:uncharacterized linocin/CFP29 family protein
MDLLKRELAPILAEAWKVLDEEAKRVLKLNLAGRKLVDFRGPYGWNHAAVNTGRLQLLDDRPDNNVSVGVRTVKPLIEVRAPILLDLMELDTIARGALDPDLDPVVRAAESVARTEDTAIFHGYPAAKIVGIIESSPHPPIPVAAALEDAVLLSTRGAHHRSGSLDRLYIPRQAPGRTVPHRVVHVPRPRADRGRVVEELVTRTWRPHRFV